MKGLKHYIILVFVTLISGCATTDKPDVITAENGSAVAVFSTPAPADLNHNRYTLRYLRIVTPGHNAVMKTVAVLSLVTGNFNSGSFNKENYKGKIIESLENPTVDYFIPKAKPIVRAWLNEHAEGYQYKQPLYLSYADWALIVKDAMATDSLYQLKYKIIFYKLPEDGGRFTPYTVAECAPSPVEATLADWQANNYQKVTEETENYMNGCLTELNNQLPRLLKR